MTVSALPVIEVRGNAAQRGAQQGEGARAQIHLALNRYREILPQSFRLDWKQILEGALEFLPFAEDSFPQSVAEARGIADGAGVPFEEVWALNCYEELTDLSQPDRGCTSIALQSHATANGHVLIAHNEDWLSMDRDTVYLVRGDPVGEPNFIGLAYGPLLVNIGFNEEGIGVAINSVRSKDVRLGVPRIIYSRAVLKAHNLEDAVQTCLPLNRAGGYHFMLAAAEGEILSLETSANLYDTRHSKGGWLLHTNHYLSPKMRPLEKTGDYANSILRFKRAVGLLREQLGKITVEYLQEILRDHKNQPHSICDHEDPSQELLERSQTVASIVMDLTEGKLWAAPGPPCQGEFITHDVNGFQL